MGKVFGIGLSKTGLTSLSKALRQLGYKTIHYPRDLRYIDEHDAATDLLVVLNYKKLDKKYPNSKFILTIRDYSAWIKSIKNHYDKSTATSEDVFLMELRRKVWGDTHYNKKMMTETYNKHIKDVMEYFKERKEDLLVMDIAKGDGWDVLCTFLDKKLPTIPFPKENIGSY